MTFLRNIWNDEQGQDLIEYTLLMAFVALASAALFIGAGGSIKGIWSSTNSQLAAANTSASLTGKSPQRVKKSSKTRRRVAVELPIRDDRDRYFPAAGAGGSSRAKQGSR
jgi:Flp pilus assembly pilin Flp